MEEKLESEICIGGGRVGRRDCVEVVERITGWMEVEDKVGRWRKVLQGGITRGRS